jgi:hypothetical protein
VSCSFAGRLVRTRDWSWSWSLAKHRVAPPTAREEKEAGRSERQRREGEKTTRKSTHSHEERRTTHASGGEAAPRKATKTGPYEKARTDQTNQRSEKKEGGRGGSERTQGDERREKTRGKQLPHLAPLLQTAPRNETRDPQKCPTRVRRCLGGGGGGGGPHTLLLSGTAEIKESAERAAVFAVLDATNRWTEMRREG